MNYIVTPIKYLEWLWLGISAFIRQLVLILDFTESHLDISPPPHIQLRKIKLRDADNFSTKITHQEEYEVIFQVFSSDSSQKQQKKIILRHFSCSSLINNPTIGKISIPFFCTN